jgi:hypothetical protein
MVCLRAVGLLVVALLLASAPAAEAKRKLVQPKAGSVWTGRASNGGVVTLEIKRIWDVGAERIRLYPLITWTRVGAICDVFNGQAFVPTPKRITARLQATTPPGAVRKGRFDETVLYAGAAQSRFKGTFTRSDVQGTVHKITTRGTDLAVGYGCRWGPLTFDLAKSSG